MRKVFMENKCNHPYCRDGNCEKCIHYNPIAFGAPVPKWLGNILYAVEGWLNRKEFNGTSF